MCDVNRTCRSFCKMSVVVIAGCGGWSPSSHSQCCHVWSQCVWSIGDRTWSRELWSHCTHGVCGECSSVLWHCSHASQGHQPPKVSLSDLCGGLEQQCDEHILFYVLSSFSFIILTALFNSLPSSRSASSLFITFSTYHSVYLINFWNFFPRNILLSL